MPPNVSRSVATYIACVVLAATLSVAALAAIGPSASWQGLLTALFLCGIGWAGSRFTYEMEIKGARGSIGYLLFPAAGLAVADWTVPVIVGATVITLELGRRAQLPKIVFNTGATILASAASIILYHLAGGEAWSTHSRFLATYVVPVVLLVLSSRLINSVALAGVLSLSQRLPFWRTWRGVTGRTLVDDVLVSPLIAVFAYTVVAWGFAPTLAAGATLIGVNRLYQTNVAMQHLSRELLELMVSAIEARDPYTSGHSRRVAAMAVVIARSVGLPQRDVQRIEVAGLLHDVGKIHEKYAAILRKPDRLSKDEWLLMKEHPIDGEALVAKVSQLNDIRPAVRHHHEKWDGSGYPDGIAGNDIPLAARILAIADTIDAMTSDRPYRRALTQDEVRHELLEWAGKQFDPSIVPKLLASPHWDALFKASETEGTRFEIRLVGARAATA
jgi:putative nucleotidyltransferase with HDIG domain